MGVVGHAGQPTDRISSARAPPSPSSQGSSSKDLALTIRTFYLVRMIINALKMSSRLVLTVIVTVILLLLVFAVAGASILGVSLAVQGWAANPPTTIQAPASR